MATDTTTTINTGGGAAVSGNVTAHTFIGRDNVNNVNVTNIGYTAEQVRVLIAGLRRDDQPQAWDGRLPYVGLESFQELDAPLFFGREKLVAQLRDQLRTSRFLCVAGPSGSGKSSLIRAGLIPALRLAALPGSDKWLIDICTPLNNPMTQLANAMSAIGLRAGLGANAGDDLWQKSQTSPSALSDLADVLARGGPGQRVVIFIDQFEETFIPTLREDERRTFLTQIVEASRHENGRVTVVTGLRSDFISQCATYPDLRASLSGGFQLVGAMEPDELTRAIALPALEVGVTVEPELIAQIVNDMKGEPGALPLMQFALRDLFDSQPRHIGDDIRLTLADYLDRGGIGLALNRHADATLNTLDDAGKGLARSIFSNLITIDSKGTVSRRTASFAELTPAGVDEQAIEAVVQRLAAARLLTTDAPLEGRPTVTLAHEKLIESWAWLQRLVNDDRASIALQNEISDDAADWDKSQRDASYLYIGARLQTSREKLRDNRIMLNALAQQFIDAGAAEESRQAQEEEATRQHELAQAKTLAAQQQQIAQEQRQRADVQERARKRVLAALAGLAVFFVAALAAAGVAYRQSRITLSEQLAAQAIRFSGDNADTALLLAKEAYDTPFTSVNARESLLYANQCCASQVTSYLRGHIDRVWGVAFNHDSQKPVLASGGDDGNVILWNVATRTEIKRLRNPVASAGLYNVAFNKDDSLLAAGSAGGAVIVWDVSSGQPFSLTGHTGNALATAFSPDGRTLASGGADGKVIVWDVAARKAITSQVQTNRWVWDVAFSPDGNTLASAGQDGSLLLWTPKPDSGAITTTVVVTSVDGNRINNTVAVAFSPDGRTLATGHTAGRVRIWDMTPWLERREKPVLLTMIAPHNNIVWGVAFDARGRLATASNAGRMHLWRIERTQPDKVIVHALSSYLDGHAKGIFGIAFDATGDRLAAAGLDDLVSVWNTAPDGRAGNAFIGHHASILSLQPSADGQMLRSISADGHVITWDVPGRQVRTDITLTQPITHAVIGNDGTFIATDGLSNSVLLWRADEGKISLIATLTGHAAPISSLAFSPDGKRLATGSDDGQILLWDVDKRQRIGMAAMEFVGKGRVNSLAFSADGARLAAGGCGTLIRAESLGCGRGEFRIYRVGAGGLAADGDALAGKSGYVTSLAFSPDGTRLGIGSDDNVVVVWDLNRRAEVDRLYGHTDRVNALAFTPDGRALASASDDANVLLWSLERGRIFGRPFSQLKSDATALAFNADGTQLFTAGRDGDSIDDRIIVVYDLSYAHLHDRACQLANRNLTHDEWSLYLGNEPYRKTCADLP